jgi:branched-chain amino acid transport system ATP-binding protein
MAAMPSQLEVRGLRASRGRVPVLFGVDCQVDAGRVAAIIGANGAGKSTLLRVLSGMTPAAGGFVGLGGEDVTHWPAWKRVRAGIVHVPEGRRVFGDMTVTENLEVGAIAAGKRLSQADVAMVFDLFPRLGERRLQQAGTLSGGEQQMLAISRALVAAPKVLLIDEPSMGLAPVATARVAEALQSLRARGDLSILLVEQNVSLATTLADDAYVMQRGVVSRADLQAGDELTDVVLGVAEDEEPSCS